MWGIGIGRPVAGSMYGEEAGLSGGGDTWISGFEPLSVLESSEVPSIGVASSQLIVKMR